MIKKLVSHLGEYKAASIKTPLFAALEAIMDVLLPTIMAFIIDQGIEKGDMNAIIRYGLLTFLVAAIALVLGVLAGKYAAEASTGFAGNLRDAMYENIQHYSFSNIDKFSTAGLVTRMTTDVTNVQNAFQMILRMCVRAPVHLVFAMFMAVIIGGPLSLVFVVAVAFLVAVLAAIMIPTFHIFDRVFKNYDNLNASVQENVSAIRVVKSFVREGFENEKYTAACESLYKQFVNAESRLSFNNPAMLVAVYGCNIALSWFGAKYVLHGAITTGQLNALFGYIMNILMALMMLSTAFVMIAMSAASAKRIVEVLDEHTDLSPAKQPVQQVADGSIQFDHVTFKYKHGSGQPVLNDISFTIRPGETLGIIGGTGSAKSSLVQLIPRLYDAESGTVRVGGVDVRDYNLDVLRREVSMVLQKNVLFSGTILDNLRWGDANATEEECIRMAKLACADEFIQRFPDKYNTWIEQGGSNVSGGQKQRLTIARALLRKPKVLILDDSTSAVDTATDAKIRKAFREEIPGTTKIIIAQRISSVQDADRILVLENGQINGLGTHAELLATNAIYQEVYNSQTQGGGDFDKQGGAQ
ncbi:MAG: ABC transporter ATP-binding protein [Faecalibacterium prausnitzii]|jgi:ATP-binding cassette subfamily B multidrug efflux pump|uniref:ATP-binding cassette domain-containing protein n=1 Tax=Faecalibacterium prausnitzii TaxID=853 RepID=A0A6A8KLX9_9FIRM|nr:ABC transporter ATP-binding protein [Faecalibacterium prausnitzii]MEE1538446.1 ABC transporter ATP-binding protein [Faecalibacterium prausnitzii]MSC44763.1 ATP-binding cassette domain-containing protein [Faecalibacterium prausnitzii]MSC48117.1 ATP-binding cassette domain-containing protein [Faecalibacterium prausnitzii]MSC68190.1 ATP-binding cassette domain-containing protein [Faecalibacterium prausnitzii]MSC74575.1 ATP-binding cassette domain-containing protein [Faecalibacterium prausnitzi